MAAVSHPPTPDVSRDAIMAGACELGVLEETWEHYFARPAYNYLFVIDAPAIAAVHALPPHNIPHFGLTSFLDSPGRPARLRGMSFERRQQHYREQSKLYPLTLAMTEILARYIFTSRWSGGEPKFIIPHQLGQLTWILDSVEQRSVLELRRAIRSAGDAESLKELRRNLGGVSSADTLLTTISDRLEELLPEIYGTYTDSRQLFRYLDVLPFGDAPDCPSAFIDSVAQFRAIVEQSASLHGDHSPLTITRKWGDSIPPNPLHYALLERYGERVPRPEESRTHEEQARTLAEIEVINRALEASGDRHRLIFITPTGRLFRAALRRFGRLPDQHGRRRLQFGSPDSFDKLYYHATALIEDSQALAPMPLMDPRVLMASPDFVQYASRRDITVTDYTSRSISAWIPLFFSSLRTASARLDVARLWQKYEQLQRGAPHASDLDPDSALQSLEEFDTQALRASWESYIRIVAAAESSDRVIRRESFAALRAALKEANPEDALQVAVARQLDARMSRWLSHVGSKAIQGILARHKKRAGEPVIRFAAAPPMIMPSLSAGTVAIDELAMATHPGESQAITLAWLTDPTLLHPTIAPDDKHRELKTRYLQILGQSALFAALEDWESAHTLADQAYSLADSVLAHQSRAASPTYVSGREAAYFASATKRRLLSSHASIDQLVGEGTEWVSRFRVAIDREVDLQNEASVRLAVHRARAELEEAAWLGLRWLYRSWESDANESSSQLAAALGTLKPVHLLEKYESLIVRLGTQLLPKVDENTYVDEKARLSYSYAVSAMLIDTAVDTMEIELIAGGRRGADPKRLMRCLRALDQPQLDRRLRTGTPRRTFVREQLVLQAATGVATDTSSTAYERLGNVITGLDGLDRWRARMLLQCVGR